MCAANQSRFISIASSWKKRGASRGKPVNRAGAAGFAALAGFAAFVGFAVFARVVGFAAPDRFVSAMP